MADIDVADIDVAIFTFTATEATAVRALLQDLVDSTRTDTLPWTATLGAYVITRTLSDGTKARIAHKHLNAQGNVVAAAELARAADYENRDADYYIFYGCCGAIDKELVGQIFRISSVSYLSLGAVTNTSNKVAAKQPEEAPPTEAGTGTGTEVVKVKNKWLVRTDPGAQPPMGSVVLRTGSRRAPGRLRLLDLPDAFVLATDKVIKIAPGPNAPTPDRSDLIGPVFSADEWTYGEALAHCKERVPGPVLIDMETFGIASTMSALALGDRVLVLRVVTDAGSSKQDQTDEEQLKLLMQQREVLGNVLATIMGLADDDI